MGRAYNIGCKYVSSTLAAQIRRAQYFGRAISGTARSVGVYLVNEVLTGLGVDRAVTAGKGGFAHGL